MVEHIISEQSETKEIADHAGLLVLSKPCLIESVLQVMEPSSQVFLQIIFSAAVGLVEWVAMVTKLFSMKCNICYNVIYVLYKNNISYNIM